MTATRPIDPALARTWLMLSGRPGRDYASAVAGSAADAAVIDLEDAVPPSEKEAARARLVAWLSSGGRAWVRIDARGTEHWAASVNLLRRTAGLAGVVLAKTEAPGEVADTAIALPGVPIVPLIESARGLTRVEQIAATPGVLRLGFGTGDFRRDTGLPDTATALAYAHGRITVAGAAAGLTGAIDGGAVGEDATALREQAAVAATHGFTAKFALRESQIAPLNLAFTPSADEVEEAAAAVAASEAAAGPGGGDDLPRLLIARRLLARAHAYGH